MNKNNYVNNMTLAAAVALAIGLPVVSHAQIEKIVVTAQKRSESVQDVPIAINALAGDLLDDMGVRDTDDIEKLYPNLSTNNRSAVNTGFAIRGVDTNNFHVSAKQSTGVNIDGVAAFSPFMSTVGGYEADSDSFRFAPQHDFEGAPLNWISAYDELYVRNVTILGGLTGFQAA